MADYTQKNPPESNEQKQSQEDANRDPLSGRAGAHPVGTGIGAAAGGVAGGVAGGAATGAAIGAAGGPVGAAIGVAAGAVAGAVLGGLAGKAVAESVDPTVEHGYWSRNYSDRPYVTSGEAYDEYAPAYQYGWENSARSSQSFEQAEPTLERDWDKVKGKSNLEWDRAKDAVRDSWNRISSRRRGQSENVR